GLTAGQCPKGSDVVLEVQQLPEAFRALPRQRVLDPDRSAQLHDLLGRVRALDSSPPGARPFFVQRSHLALERARLRLAVRLHAGSYPLSRSRRVREWSGTPRTPGTAPPARTARAPGECERHRSRRPGPRAAGPSPRS